MQPFSIRLTIRLSSPLCTFPKVRSIACVIIGFAVIYRNKSIHHKAHFTSRHGQLGLATFLLATLSPLLGAFSFKSLGLINVLPGESHPAHVMPLHL